MVSAASLYVVKGSTLVQPMTQDVILFQCHGVCKHHSNYDKINTELQTIIDETFLDSSTVVTIDLTHYTWCKI